MLYSSLIEGKLPRNAFTSRPIIRLAHYPAFLFWHMSYAAAAMPLPRHISRFFSYVYVHIHIYILIKLCIYFLGVTDAKNNTHLSVRIYWHVVCVHACVLCLLWGPVRIIERDKSRRRVKSNFCFLFSFE